MTFDGWTKRDGMIRSSLHSRNVASTSLVAAIRPSGLIAIERTGALLAFEGWAAQDWMIRSIDVPHANQAVLADSNHRSALAKRHAPYLSIVLGFDGWAETRRPIGVGEAPAGEPSRRPARRRGSYRRD